MTIVAIDGPGGSGKSTLARELAKRLLVERLDTGAMYRAVALAALRAGVDSFDERGLARIAGAITLERDGSVLLDGKDVTREIRSPAVDAAVSAVAALPAVRAELVARQRAWIKERGGAVVEGRDIGTVVAPDADLKIYLTADPAVRAGRRAAERRAGDEAGVVLVAEAMATRDATDASRADSPLTRAPDAVEIDTSESSVEELLERVLLLLSERR